MSKKTLVKDCVEWDIVNWSKSLRFWDENVDLENKNYKCLELGGRRGGLSLWLALKGNDVICSDLENPQVEAEVLHNKYNCGNRISYEAIDATDIPYNSHFDIIVFKSILGGISRDGKVQLAQAVIDQIFKALRPGGKLLFAENLKASMLHSFLRQRLVRWGDSWNYMDIEHLPGLFCAFQTLKYDTAGFLGAIGRSETQRYIFGRLDSMLFDWSLNHRLKYIVFGFASKS